MPTLFDSSDARSPLLPTNAPRRVEDFRYGKWARFLAQFSFVLGVGGLMYGTLGDPSLKHKSDKYWNALTPNYIIVIGLFVVHLLHQTLWLCALSAPEPSVRGRIDAWLDALRGAPPYVPIYAFSQFCLVFFIVSFVHEYFLLAFILSLLYTLAPISYITAMSVRSRESSHAASFVPRYSAALGLLGVLSTGAIVIELHNPTRIVKAFAGIMFGLAAFSDDIFLGPILVWDVVALALEHRGQWGVELWWLAFGVGVITLVRYGMQAFR